MYFGFVYERNWSTAADVFLVVKSSRGNNVKSGTKVCRKYKCNMRVGWLKVKSFKDIFSLPYSLWGFYIAFTMLLFVLSLFVTDIIAKFLFWWVWQNGGIDLDISKIWQVHKALIVSVAWYRKVFFCTDIIYVAFFPNEPL